MTTFDEFLDISATEDFSLAKDSDLASGLYVFEARDGLKMVVKQLVAPVTSSFPLWSVTINDDKVHFDNPSQLVTVDTVVKGLCSKCVKQAID